LDVKGSSPSSSLSHGAFAFADPPPEAGTGAVTTDAAIGLGAADGIVSTTDAVPFIVLAWLPSFSEAEGIGAGSARKLPGLVGLAAASAAVDVEGGFAAAAVAGAREEAQGGTAAVVWGKAMAGMGGTTRAAAASFASSTTPWGVMPSADR
jgi:hypothetical protein